MMESEGLKMKFIKIRKKLDDLGYRFPLPIEALPLTDKLLADLLKTTEGLKSIKDFLEEISKENELLKKLVNPYKRENGKLLRENHSLSVTLDELKESNNQSCNKFKAQIKELENKILDLTVYKDQCCRKIFQLDSELKEKTKSIIEMQDRIMSKCIGKQSHTTWQRQKMEITSRLDTSPTHNMKVMKVGRNDDYTVDLVALSEERVATCKHKLLKSKQLLNDKDIEIEKLKSLLINKQTAMNEMSQKLLAGMPESTVMKNCNSDFEDDHDNRVYENLLKQVEILTNENKLLHQKMDTHPVIKKCDTGTSICSDISDDEYRKQAKDYEMDQKMENLKEKLVNAESELEKCVESKMLVVEKNKELLSQLERLKCSYKHSLQDAAWAGHLKNVHSKPSGSSNSLHFDNKKLSELSATIDKNRSICRQNFEKVRHIIKSRSEILAPYQRYSGGQENSTCPASSEDVVKTSSSSSDVRICCCDSSSCTRSKSSGVNLNEAGSEDNHMSKSRGHNKENIPGVKRTSKYANLVSRPSRFNDKRVTMKLSPRPSWRCQSTIIPKKPSGKLKSRILQSEIEKLRIELEQEKNEKSSLVKKISEANEKLDNCSTSNDIEKKLRKDVNDMKKTIKLYEAKISELCHQNERLDVGRRRLENELMEIKLAHEMGKSEIKEMAAQNQIYPSLAAQERLRNLESECHNWRETANDYKREVEKLATRLNDDSSGMSDELLKLRSQAEVLKMENHRLNLERQSQQGEMRSQLDSKHSLDSELVNQTEKAKSLQRKVCELELESGKYRKLYMDIEREYRFLQSEVSQKQALLADNHSSLSTAKRELRSTKDRLIELESKFEKSESAVVTLNNQILNLKDKLKEKDDGFEELRLTIQEKDFRLEDLLAMKTSSEKSLEKALHDLSEKQEEISHLQHHISRLDIEIRELQKENHSIRSENRRLHHDMSIVVKDSKCLSTDLENAREECNRLKVTMQDYCNEVKRFQELIQTKEIEQQQLMEQYKNLTLETSSFMVQKAAFEDDYNSLRSSLEEKISELNKVMETLSIQDQEIQDFMEIQAKLEDEVHKLRNECADLQYRLTNVTRERDDIVQDLNRLKDFNYDLQIAKEKLRQHLCDVETEKNKVKSVTVRSAPNVESSETMETGENLAESSPYSRNYKSSKTILTEDVSPCLPVYTATNPHTLFPSSSELSAPSIQPMERTKHLARLGDANAHNIPNTTCSNNVYKKDIVPLPFSEGVTPRTSRKTFVVEQVHGTRKHHWSRWQAHCGLVELEPLLVDLKSLKRQHNTVQDSGSSDDRSYECVMRDLKKTDIDMMGYHDYQSLSDSSASTNLRFDDESQLVTEVPTDFGTFGTRSSPSSH